MRTAALAILLIAGAVACAGREDARPRSDKPHAPVELDLQAVALGEGRYLVALEGRALADLEFLELVLLTEDGARIASLPSGAIAAGETRLLSVQIDGEGRTLVGAARTPAGSRAVTVAIGSPAAKPGPAPRAVVTPFGPVAEVRE